MEMPVVRSLVFGLVGFVLSMGVAPAVAQVAPRCNGDSVTICVTQEIAIALGLCDAVPEGLGGLIFDQACIDDLCAGLVSCCDVTFPGDDDPNCPAKDPCPVGLEGLIQKIEDDGVPVLVGLITNLVNCCGNGTDVQAAIDAYKYFFPDTTLSDSDLEDMFSAAASAGGCTDDGGPDDPPEPPVDPWPNGVTPNDGPPSEPGAGPGSPNRGGRCEGIGLTGNPDFEQFSNDPAECAGGSSIGIFNIDMFSGKWAKQSVDLALPAKGFSWIISRTYNATQQRKNGADYDFVHSNGMQGYDWRQDSLPELAYNQTDEALYLIMNAQSYLAFGKYEEDNTSDLWVPTGSKGGAAVRSINTAGTTDIEVYEVFDLSGLKMTFFGFTEAIDSTKQGQLWKIEDPAGNVAYIGHETLPDTALTDGFIEVGTGTGNYAVKNAYDTSGRLYRYAYSAQPIDENRSSGAHRLVSVTAYPAGDDTDPYVAKVEYGYYDWLTWTGQSGTSTPEADGLPGDLKLVKVSTPTSLGTEDIVERTHYRYWKESDTDGFDHAIKYIYDSEGLRRADIDLSDGDHRTDDVLSESLADMKVYALQYMEYNDTVHDLTFGTINDRRIKNVWGNGECGCGGTSASGEGIHKLSYQPYYNTLLHGTPGTPTWYTRTVIEFPKAIPSEPNASTRSLERYEIVYFGIGGSKMATVITDESPSTTTNAWVTLTKYNSLSLGASQYTPAAISDYDHGDGSFTEAGTGLVYEYVSWKFDDVGGTTGVDDRNFGRTRFVGWKDGGASSISAYLSETEQEFAEADVSVGGDSVTLAKAFTKRTQRYPEGGTVSDATGYEETTIVRAFYSGAGTNNMESLRTESITINQPGVSTAENGNGTGDFDPSTMYYRLDGTASWVKEADGIFSYTKYDDFNMPIWSVQDADPGAAEVSGDLPAGGLTATGTPLHIKSVYEYDDQMRLTKMILPHGREMYEHYDVLDNGLIVGLSFPLHSSGTVTGPASFNLMGHNGASYQSGSLALDPAGEATSGAASWVDSTDTDAFAAFSGLGDLVRLSETVYDEPGAKAVASRVYYDIDGTTGNQYDETTYAYDDRGRAVRAEAPHGTVTRTTFDGLGRVVAQWMGTNDSLFPGSSGSGDNMTKISETVYDDGNVGNNLVTKTTQFVNATTADDRVATYIYDVRNRLVVKTSPESPHSVIEYDNLNRSVYSASYSDVSNGTLFNADTKPSTLEDNRLSLSQTMYDTRGRAYESRTYEIDQADGSRISGGAVYLFSKTWYSDVGQVIKTTGRSISKTSYDRLRRPTTRYSMSSVNEADTAYADADDVTDDYVVGESHTLWDDDSGLMLASMSVQRHPEDTATTGALFTPGSTPSLWEESANLKGRVRISAMWYDGHDRVIQSVDYGTYGLDSTVSGESFGRLDSAFDTAPAVTSLVGASLELGHFVIRTYNEDGEAEIVEVANDEDGVTGADWVVKTKTVFDDMGRVAQRIENWNGDVSPTPALPDINRITELQYTDGLMTKQIAKNAKDTGTGTVIDSQETEYTFGTTKGTGESDAATGHLLESALYPDTSGASDGVFYEYNALGQRKETTDQAGNIIEMNFDKRGRTTARRVEALGLSFDGFVRRIETGYDSRGLVNSVKQYGDTDGTMLRDTVDLEYDNWGVLEKSKQDPDNIGALDVDFTTEFSLGQISTIRRTEIKYPSGARAVYSYGTFGSIDNNLSRVSRIDYDQDGTGGVAIGEFANYTYAGRSMLMRTTLNTGGPQKYNSYYDPADPDGYEHLDDFSRPTKSFWAHDNSQVSPALADLKFYEVSLFYDVASNIEAINDQVTNQNQSIGVDDFRRLTDSTIGNQLQEWKYDHLGNWTSYTFTKNSTVEILDTREFNLVNEITDRDLKLGMAPVVAKDPVYDAVGNMTDDGRYYDYKYDAFGRITQVTDSATSTVVAEYKYNGLYNRTITRTDRDSTGGLDSEEYHHIYDDRWRVVEIYRKPVSGSRDAEPKESTLYHAAGVGGSSSPLDSVIARFRSDDDDNGPTGSPEADWPVQADGDMDQITWYFQNWRGDVVFINGHGTTERIAYSPYGTPKGYGAGDQNINGAVDAQDNGAWIANFNNGNARADVNFDGTIAGGDFAAWIVEFNTRGGTTGGEGVLSPWLDNHIGYAGYRLTDLTLTTVWHVRYRDFVPEIGTWTKRDPIGYAGGQNLYGYVGGDPIGSIDPMGLLPSPKCGSGCGGGDRGGGRAALQIDLTPSQMRKRAKDIDQCIKLVKKAIKNMATQLADIPNCPCSLMISPTQGKAFNPNRKKWDNPKPAKQKYHPGAAYCMRSKKIKNIIAGQQCCYNSDGMLITRGPGAGTPDIVTPNYRWPSHWWRDVRPYNICKRVGLLGMYLKGWPPNNGNNCTSIG